MDFEIQEVFEWETEAEFLAQGIDSYTVAEYREYQRAKREHLARKEDGDDSKKSLLEKLIDSASASAYSPDGVCIRAVGVPPYSTRDLSKLIQTYDDIGPLCTFSHIQGHTIEVQLESSSDSVAALYVPEKTSVTEAKAEDEGSVTSVADPIDDADSGVSRLNVTGEGDTTIRFELPHGPIQWVTIVVITGPKDDALTDRGSGWWGRHDVAVVVTLQILVLPKVSCIPHIDMENFPKATDPLTSARMRLWEFLNATWRIPELIESCCDSFDSLKATPESMPRMWAGRSLIEVVEVSILKGVHPLTILSAVNKSHLHQMDVVCYATEFIGETTDRPYDTKGVRGYLSNKLGFEMDRKAAKVVHAAFETATESMSHTDNSTKDDTKKALKTLQDKKMTQKLKDNSSEPWVLCAHPIRHLPQHDGVSDIDMFYDSSSYYKALVDAIRGANKRIFITGWMLTPWLELVRDASDDNGITLADLLLLKIKEREAAGLADLDIRVSLWDSVNAVMKNRSSHVIATLTSLSPKIQASHHRAGYARQWTHHQKTVVVDDIAFLGGIDIGLGRYEDSDCQLYRAQSSQHYWHNEDFYHPSRGYDNTLENHLFRRRLPWHDTQVRVSGAIVDDVVNNFEERWDRSRWKKRKGVKSVARSLAKESDNAADAGEMVEHHDKHPQRESYCQLVRSFPSWARGSGNNTDASLGRAWGNMFDVAETYIYIETQYFLAFECEGLLAALACRMLAKPELQVVIVMPRMPDSDDGTVRTEMLSLQRKTILQLDKWMKELGVEDAVERIGFFYLLPDEASLPPPNADSRPALHKFHEKLDAGIYASHPPMIYVHSKLCLVDDKYALIGSGNFNDRSLFGHRDSEIGLLIQDERKVTMWREALTLRHAGTVLEPKELCTMALAEPGRLRNLRNEALDTWNAPLSFIKLANIFVPIAN